MGEFCIGLGVLDWVDAYMPKSGKGAVSSGSVGATESSGSMGRELFSMQATVQAAIGAIPLSAGVAGGALLSGAVGELLPLGE